MVKVATIFGLFRACQWEECNLLAEDIELTDKLLIVQMTKRK